MASGHRALAKVLVAVMGTGGFACAHLGNAAPERPMLTAGKYAVQSIRSDRKSVV